MRDEQATQSLNVGGQRLLPRRQDRSSQLPNLTFGPQLRDRAVHSVLAARGSLIAWMPKTQVRDRGQFLNKMVDYIFLWKPIVASRSAYSSMIVPGFGTYAPACNAPAVGQELRRCGLMGPARRGEIGEHWRTGAHTHPRYKRLEVDRRPRLPLSQLAILGSVAHITSSAPERGACLRSGKGGWHH